MRTPPQPPQRRGHRPTTPDIAAPRLVPSALLPLPWRARFETAAGIALAAWGFAMVATALFHSLH